MNDIVDRLRASALLMIAHAKKQRNPMLPPGDNNFEDAALNMIEAAHMIEAIQRIFPKT